SRSRSSRCSRSGRCGRGGRGGARRATVAACTSAPEGICLPPRRKRGEHVAGVTVKRIDEMDSLGAWRVVRCRAELGVSSFGFQILNLHANDENYPEHAHAGMPPPFERANDGQEEVYIPLSGAATLIAGDAEYRLEPGMMARVGPGQMRKV